MNLPQFLKKVDALTRNSSHEQLEVFIHDIARTLPEGKRDDFINRLQAFGSVVKSDEGQQELEKQSKEEFLEEVEKTEELLTRIYDGELCLNSTLNEEYDDWYHSEEQEFFFEDPENVLDVLENAMVLVHRCVDEELYEEGYELANLFSVVRVEDRGDYMDYVGESLSLNNLEIKGLLTGDLRQLIKDSLYLAYQGNEQKDRPRCVYWMVENLEYGNEFTLEDMMQNDNKELEQFDEFLNLWLEYLGEQSGRDVEKFLVEAQSMLNDKEQSLNYARKYADRHPALYEQCLKQYLENGENQNAYAIGQEALKKIAVPYVIRSRIALLTAKGAMRMQKTEEAERCWMEAFRSKTSPVNFLRVLLEGRDARFYRKELTAIYTRLYKEQLAKKSENGDGYYSDSRRCLIEGDELRKNNLSKEGYYFLLFFDGQFQKVLAEGMNTREVLGWSMTFMKQGLRLFLLALYEGETISKVMKEMCDLTERECAFSQEKYNDGLNREIDDKNIFFFWECFQKWKKQNPVPEELKAVLMSKLESWIENRVEGIMQANRRNYYHECAAFVAAFGEVKESRGERFGKERFMETYRKRYSRRRSFIAELKSFGYRGINL